MPLDRLDQTIKFRQRENITNICDLFHLQGTGSRDGIKFFVKMNNFRSKCEPLLVFGDELLHLHFPSG
jgi:hypothetical protein